MRYMRCKCGKRECWTSMGHADCDGCEKCNTTLEEHPDDHREPIPHVIGMRWKIDQQTGERYIATNCTRCLNAPHDIRDPAEIARLVETWGPDLRTLASAPSPEERANG